MSKYTFTFKKGNITVDFSTSDKEVVERQFQIWVNDATEYAKTHPKQAVLKQETVAPKQEESKPKQQESQADKEVLEKASNLLKTINSIQNPQPEIKEETPAANFDEILEKTVENPTFEPVKSKDQVFLNLINAKNTTDKFHYLMITAYYLSEFEKKEIFTLKQINAKLMQNLSEVIDHGMLQEAINQRFIELVPDLTGTSEVGEYRLTSEGEEFFANKI